MHDSFKTSVTDLAAFLLAKGAKYAGITFDRPRHAVFLFENKNQCEGLQKDFLNNATVSARDLLLRKKELMDYLNQKKAEEVSN